MHAIWKNKRGNEAEESGSAIIWWVIYGAFIFGGSLVFLTWLIVQVTGTANYFPEEYKEDMRLNALLYTEACLGTEESKYVIPWRDETGMQQDFERCYLGEADTPLPAFRFVLEREDGETRAMHTQNWNSENAAVTQVVRNALVREGGEVQKARLIIGVQQHAG